MKERFLLWKDAASGAANDNFFDDIPLMSPSLGESSEGAKDQLLPDINDALQDPVQDSHSADGTKKEDQLLPDISAALDDPVSEKERGDDAEESPEEGKNLFNFPDGTLLDPEEARSRAEKSLPDPTNRIVEMFQKWFRGVRALKELKLTEQGAVTKEIDRLSGHSESLGEGALRAVQAKLHMTRQKALDHWARLIARPAKCDQILEGIRVRREGLEKRLQALASIGDSIPWWKLSSRAKAFVNDRYMQTKQWFQERMNIGENVSALERAETGVEDIREKAIAEKEDLEVQMKEDFQGEAENRNKILTLLQATPEDKDDTTEVVNAYILEQRGSEMALRRLMRERKIPSQQQRAIMILAQSMRSTFGEVTLPEMEGVYNDTMKEVEATKLKESRKKKAKELNLKWNLALREKSLIDNGVLGLSFEKASTLNGKWSITEHSESEIKLQHKNRILVLMRNKGVITLHLDGKARIDLFDDLKKVDFPRSTKEQSTPSFFAAA